MKSMQCFCLVLLLTGFVAGCAAMHRPVELYNGVNHRVIAPCTNDNLCFRDTHDVAWDSWCNWNPWEPVAARHDYPVSYRTKQSEYETKRTEYIYGSTVIIPR